MKKTSTLISLFLLLACMGCAGDASEQNAKELPNGNAVIVKEESEEAAVMKEGPEKTVVMKDESEEPSLQGGEAVVSEKTEIDVDELTKIMMKQAEEEEKKNPVTLEKQETSKDVNPIDGGLFITEDGVECRSIELTCPSTVFNFGIELYNETGTDRSFDQTKFVIEMDDGEYVNPFIFEQTREPETVSGEMKRLWMAYPIHNPKELKVGDEVSIYYDGVFITKLTVEKDL